MKSVLLVEDDSRLSLALSIRLKSMDYKVATAGDAISAVSAARSSKPDIVLIDINLPGGDGFVVAERLRSVLDTATTPYIFITASKKHGLRERAMELGASAFLEKPFDAQHLARAIDESLGVAAEAAMAGTG